MSIYNSILGKSHKNAKIIFGPGFGISNFAFSESQWFSGQFGTSEKADMWKVNTCIQLHCELCLIFSDRGFRSANQYFEIDQMKARK